MRTPVMVSCSMFWISASLSWPWRVVCAHALADPARRNQNERDEEQQHPRQPAAQQITTTAVKMR